MQSLRNRTYFTVYKENDISSVTRNKRVYNDINKTVISDSENVPITRRRVDAFLYTPALHVVLSNTCL